MTNARGHHEARLRVGLYGLLRHPSEGRTGEGRRREASNLAQTGVTPPSRGNGTSTSRTLPSSRSSDTCSGGGGTHMSASSCTGQVQLSNIPWKSNHSSPSLKTA